MTTVTTKQEPALEYSRLLFANILDWYKNADLKAQILLTFDGIFLSILDSSVFGKNDKIVEILSYFGTETWILLGGMILTLIGSIYSALGCIRSRLADPVEITNHLLEIVQDSGLKLYQKPDTMWFFGHIARLKDRKRFQQRLEQFSEKDELTAISSQIFILSKNVLMKHAWVNRGFILIAVTLILFLAAATSYVIRVAV